MNLDVGQSQLADRRGQPHRATQQWFDQGEVQVRSGDRERNARQTGAGADVGDPASRSKTGAVTALLRTCRSQSRGASRGPMRPWVIPVSASRATYASATDT